MTNNAKRQLRRVSLLLMLTASLSACNAVTRIAQVGTAPPITPIENPTHAPGYRVVSLPMPDPTTDRFMSNSLWRQGARAFFKDQRAARVGDILTVVININDQATFDNETERTRENTEDSDLTNLFGLETQLEKPDGGGHCHPDPAEREYGHPRSTRSSRQLRSSGTSHRRCRATGRHHGNQPESTHANRGSSDFLRRTRATNGCTTASLWSAGSGHSVPVLASPSLPEKRPVQNGPAFSFCALASARYSSR